MTMDYMSTPREALMACQALSPLVSLVSETLNITYNIVTYNIITNKDILKC